jgi:DNA-binding YbaB/EbfC family protein
MAQCFKENPMANMNDLLRQANVMQNKINKLQQELETRTVEASSGGGMIKVEVAGNQALKSIVIDPKALEGGDMDMLQDLILAAVNEGVRVSKAMKEREITNLTGGLHLPGIL